MTNDYFLDDDGEQIFIHGYGAVYDVLCSNGRELVKPGAFDFALKHPSLALNCQFHHMGPDFIVGSLALDNFQVWSDTFGLAFCAGPFDANGRNASFLRLIASGEIRGASRFARPDSKDYEFIDGQRVLVIKSFKTLDHIAPVPDPAYAETGVWLSSENYFDLPLRLRALSDHWSANRPHHEPAAALRKMTRAVAALPARSAALRPKDRAAATKPIMIGLTEEEWNEFGITDAANRQTLRDAQAGKYALQRERNRWRRKARAA
jgi:phage head maturation protease